MTPARPARDDGAVGLALIRLAAVPVIIVGQKLVESPALEDPAFDVLAAVTAVYAVAALVIAVWRPLPRVPQIAYSVIDVLCIAALAYTSGGAFSQVRFAFFVLPLGAAFLLAPRPTALVGLAGLAAFAGQSFTHDAVHNEEQWEVIATTLLYLVWAGIVAILLSRLLTQRGERIAQLAAARGRLVAEAMGAEDRERKRLAEGLHDETLQNVLVARQDLDDALAGDTRSADRVRLALDRTGEQLREAVFALHPQVLEQAGLAAALRTVLDYHAGPTGWTWETEVDPEATGVHDALLLSVARELIVNVRKHAAADHVSVRVHRTDDTVVLGVIDDGRGIVPERVDAAFGTGGIGLASVAERARALGGQFAIAPRPEGGTAAAVSLPAAGPALPA